ncbi:response regulator transcription factor [Limnohabitans sp.]|uniref:response regulator transcription factor n=1 Tax=Limnohabitans sp. TaxID=1907725 RepID=UPI00311E1326
MQSPQSLHILIVEDNDGLREATAAFLQDLGHRVTSLDCAEDIDNTPTHGLPDLYIIDVNLPGENGFSLAERIRKSHPTTGIVLMTARGQLQDRLEGYACGADNYLIKPVEQAELLACVNSLARRVRASAPIAENPTLALNSQTWWLTGPKEQVLLTQGEGLLLAAMSRAAGQQLERWQAMQLIDTKDKGLLPANLEMRISALRKKLSACGAPEDTIRTLRGYGYALGYPLKVV